MDMGVFGGWIDVGVLGGGWTRESGGGQVRGGWTDELVYLVSPPKTGWPGLRRGGVGGYNLHSLWHTNHEQAVSIWCCFLL